MKQLIKKLFNLAGLKISRVDGRRVSEADQFKWLGNFSVKTVIDIGASKGNSVLEFRKLFPVAIIYAFEPLKDCFDIMQERFDKKDRIKLYNMALGDRIGETNFFRSAYSGASSLRPMADLHKNLFPHTAGQVPENIKIDTLDNILGPKNFEDDILIKLDVQGYEDKVIAGGGDIFKRAKIVICETSYRPLYVGQPLFADIHNLLTDLGFVYAGIWGQEFKNPSDGQPLQQDSIFIKP